MNDYEKKVFEEFSHYSGRDKIVFDFTCNNDLECMCYHVFNSGKLVLTGTFSIVSNHLEEHFHKSANSFRCEAVFSNLFDFIDLDFIGKAEDIYFSKSLFTGNFCDKEFIMFGMPQFIDSKQTNVSFNIHKGIVQFLFELFDKSIITAHFVY